MPDADVDDVLTAVADIVRCPSSPSMRSASPGDPIAAPDAVIPGARGARAGPSSGAIEPRPGLPQLALHGGARANDAESQVEPTGGTGDARRTASLVGGERGVLVRALP